MEWQKIETAPKDGTTIFIWYAGEVRKAAYLNTAYTPDPGWHLFSYNSWNLLFDIPEYWMPIPKGPAINQTDNKS